MGVSNIMKLNKIVQVKNGKNSSRNKDSHEEVMAYTYEDLVKDLGEFSPYHEIFRTNGKSVDDSSDTLLVSNGNVVFSFVSSTSGIVSEANEGKVLNQNFAKLIINHKQLDPRYLCYCLNESIYVKQQIAGYMEGGILRRLKPSSLRDLDIPILDFSKQQFIGHAYFSLLRRKYLQEQKLKQEESYVLALLEKQFESENNT